MDPTKALDDADLLAQAEARASENGFVSYQFEVPELDPLAVLETLDEPRAARLFREPFPPPRPCRGRSRSGSGADAANVASPTPTPALRELDASLTSVGQRPRVIATFPFYPGTETEGAEARLFLPGWQVVSEDGVTTVTLVELAGPGCAAVSPSAPTVSAGSAIVPRRPPRAPRSRRCCREVGEAWFPSAVLRATELIKEGSFEKIVLSRGLRLAPQRALQHLRDPAAALRRGNPQCHTFLVDDEDEGSLVGNAAPGRCFPFSTAQSVPESIWPAPPAAANGLPKTPRSPKPS
jgi:hypothetical protein